MESGHAASERWRIVGINLLLALAYLAAARASLLLSHPDIKVSAVWWPSGIAMALALRHGWRVLPGIALGDLAAGLSFGSPPGVALLVAVGGVAEAALACRLLRGHVRDDSGLLRHRRGVTRFIVLGALLSPLASAAFGVPALLLGGIVAPQDWVRATAVWWTGDVVGVLGVYPLVASLLAPPASSAERRGLPALLAVLLATAGAFLLTSARTPGHQALPFLVLPVVVLGALHMGSRTAAWVNAGVAALTLFATVLGRGPFALSGSANDVWLLQAFVIAASVTVLVIVAANHDLRRATVRERQAELLARSRSELLATMSHEVRTPLNGLLGMLELLSRGPLAEPQRDMLALSKRAGQHLLRMVDDVLQGARLEAGHIDVVVGPVALGPLCEMVVEQMAPQAQQRGLALMVQLDPALAQGHVTDQTRVVQLLFNLLSNAIKFTTHGVVRVVVQAEQPVAASEAGGSALQRVTIAVSDTGRGIAPDDLPRLFQAYSRVGQDTGRAQDGTGLGLFICQRLAGALGGEVRVSSELGVGSTFAIELPLPVVTPARATPALFGVRVGVAVPDSRLVGQLEQVVQSHGGQVLRVADGATEPNVVVVSALDGLPTASPWPVAAGQVLTLVPQRSDEAARAGRTLAATPLLPSRLLAALREAAGLTPPVPTGSGLSSAPAAAVPPRAATGWHVLVADDDPVNRLVIEGQLLELGHHPTCVDDGEAAWEAWQAGGFTLLLTDGLMPRLDGYGLAERLRAEERRRGLSPIPIFLVTGDGSEVARQRAHDVGITALLLKPFDLPALRSTLAAAQAPHPQV